STGNMWKHVKRAHPDALNAQQPDAGSRGAVYSHDVFHGAVVEWIITSNQPFSEVRAPSFREMIRASNPNAKVPSKGPVRHNIDARFEEEKEHVRDVLKGVPGRLSFAVDIWTSSNVYAFLGIVVHWTDVEWQPRNLLMDMPPLAGGHTGKNLCDAFKR